MAALTADRETSSKTTGLKSYPVADNVVIYKGSIVAINTLGYAQPAASTASFLVAGIADSKVDNTLSGHTAGGKSIRVVSSRHFLLDATGTPTQATVGQKVFVIDDHTVNTVQVNNVLVGQVTEFVSATSLWVCVVGLGE
jgi:hypothetical protein